MENFTAQYNVNGHFTLDRFSQLRCPNKNATLSDQFQHSRCPLKSRGTCVSCWDQLSINRLIIPIYGEKKKGEEKRTFHYGSCGCCVTSRNSDQINLPSAPSHCALWLYFTTIFIFFAIASHHPREWLISALLMNLILRNVYEMLLDMLTHLSILI